MILLQSEFVRWLKQHRWIEALLELPWHRIETLYIGEKLALASLTLVCVIGWIAAGNRFFACQFSMPANRKTLRIQKRKTGFGIKHFVLILIALLPGGMVGMFTIYAIMGKELWRRDALLICGISLVPAALLLGMRLESFPWPQIRDGVYVSGLLGLIFGLLHFWALTKLLREWWGEPDECVAWWPPLALWAQVSMLSAAALRILF